MTNPLSLKSWPPYVVGVGIGLLSWFAFATANHPLGISTAFEHTAALSENGPCFISRFRHRCRRRHGV